MSKTQSPYRTEKHHKWLSDRYCMAVDSVADELYDEIEFTFDRRKKVRGSASEFRRRVLEEMLRLAAEDEIAVDMSANKP